MNTWISLSGGTVAWYVQTPFSGANRVAEFTIEIRKTGTTTILDSATITLEVEAF